MRSNARQLLAIATTSALMWSSAQAAPTVYDAVNDFSSTSNTATDTWSYRTSTSLAHDGNYTLLPGYGVFAGFTGSAADTSGWSTGFVPAIGVNRSSSDQYFVGFGPGAQFTWPAGALYLHPGSSTLAVVSWLSPGAFSLDISFQFSDLDANPSFPTGIDWTVEKNSGAGTLASGSFANGGSSGSRSVSQIVVAAGDRINFIVGPNGDYQGDSSRLSAVITATPVGPVSPVPEPGTMALWLAGLVSLIAVTGRRRAR